MFCIRVGRQLDSRIDAEFYSPSALRAEEAVKAFREVRRFGDVVSDGYRVVYHGIDAVSPMAQDQSLKFLAPTDVDDQGAIDLTSCLKVPGYYSSRYPKGKGRAGELLIEVKGNVSKVAVLPSTLPEDLMISGSFYKATVGEADVHFVLAFLKSSYGTILKKRLASNSIIDYVAKGDLYSIPIPYPAPVVQDYIGGKVRQAAILRDCAAQDLKKASTLLESSLKWNDDLIKAHRFRRLKPSEVSDRLDGNFNSPTRLHMMEHLASHRVQLDELSILADVSAMIGWKGLTTEHYTETGPWLLRGVEIVNGVIDFDALVSVAQDKYDEQPQIHLKSGDVALSKDGTIGKAAVIPDLPQPMAVGSTVGRLRLREAKSLNAYYLEHVLNHAVVQTQIASFATGMAQPHITQEWIEQIQIPRVSGEETIATLVKRHHVALATARDLALAARFLVEALIDGRLTESELVEAHRGLAKGDPSADRSILQRLTRKGFEAPGVPKLFVESAILTEILADLVPPKPGGSA